jgi:hypothetical protein
MIEITRVYIGSGLSYKVMVNPLYIKEIEPLQETHRHVGIAETLIVMDGGQNENALVYSADTYSAIKRKITLARKGK